MEGRRRDVADKDQGVYRACIPLIWPNRSPDEILWFSWLSSCDLLSGKNASSMLFSHSVVSNSLQHTMSSLSITISQSLLKLMSIESVIPSSHLILGRPILLLPSIFPSSRVFSNELAFCIRWPKYWSFSPSISPSNEYSGLISSRIDWFDLPVVQGILKSLLQYQVSKTSTPSTCWGFYFCRRAQGYFYVYPLR